MKTKIITSCICISIFILGVTFTILPWTPIKRIIATKVTIDEILTSYENHENSKNEVFNDLQVEKYEYEKKLVKLTGYVFEVSESNIKISIEKNGNTLLSCYYDPFAKLVAKTLSKNDKVIIYGQVGSSLWSPFIYNSSIKKEATNENIE